MKTSGSSRLRCSARVVTSSLIRPSSQPPSSGSTGVSPILSSIFSRTEVDGTPIVGIDEVQVPQLGALVKIRNTRRGDLQHYLGERVRNRERRDPLLEGKECRQELAAAGPVEDRVDERRESVLVSLVWRQPAGMHLRLAGGLDHVPVMRSMNSCDGSVTFGVHPPSSAW